MRHGCVMSPILHAADLTARRFLNVATDREDRVRLGIGNCPLYRDEGTEYWVINSLIEQAHLIPGRNKENDGME